MTVVLDGAFLTLEDVVRVSEGDEPVELAGSARVAMEGARAIVEQALENGQSVYGLTTGVAERKRFALGQDNRRPFNRLLVRSHRVAQGPAARPALARATMVCLVNSYAKGIAGVRPALADMVLTALNEGFVPVMRTLGSVGQADLGPMADLAEGLLQHSGFPLEDNEGLALVNSNAFGTGGAGVGLAPAGPAGPGGSGRLRGRARVGALHCPRRSAPGRSRTDSGCRSKGRLGGRTRCWQGEHGVVRAGEEAVPADASELAGHWRRPYRWVEAVRGING